MNVGKMLRMLNRKILTTGSSRAGGLLSIRRRKKASLRLRSVVIFLAHIYYWFVLLWFKGKFRLLVCAVWIIRIITVVHSNIV
jgi:fatty acid desaturase